MYKYEVKYINGYYCVVSFAGTGYKVFQILFAKDEAERECNKLNNES